MDTQNTEDQSEALPQDALLALVQKSEVEKALREVDYKYFGDYEFSESQHEAVKTLCKIACKLYGLKNPYGG